MNTKNKFHLNSQRESENCNDDFIYRSIKECEFSREQMKNDPDLKFVSDINSHIGRLNPRNAFLSERCQPFLSHRVKECESIEYSNFIGL